MLPRLPVFSVLLAALALTVGAAATEPRNLDLAKQEIARYLDSGDYAREIAGIAVEVEHLFDKRLAEPLKPGEKLAVVFDLDETLLSNLPHMRPLGFGYVPPLWNEWVEAGSAPVIVPIARLYHFAQDHGLTVFLISGRREKDRVWTEKNLRQQGLTNYASLFLKPNESTENAKDFKTAIRRKITSEGCVIIANIGDQESDLAGGYAEKTFKLPNPFYLSE